MRKPRSEVSTLEAPGTKCYVYRGSRDRKHVENLDEISEIIREPSSLVWFDVVAPGPHDLALLQEEFDLHPLAIEDALGSHQRAKIESYGQYVFLIVHGVTHAAEGLRTHEIAIFAGEWAIGQLWLFWVAPIIGALLGAAAYRAFGEGDR